jgi:succinoglycan biosynthesis transport protein ExoP
LSKAFELLQNVEAERGTGLGPVPVNGHRTRHSVVDQEEIARLVQRIFRVPEAPRTLLFAAIDRGDGCTAICVAAAENLAATAPGSVCLVDANLRSPSIHKHFDIDNSVGLSEAILQPGAVHNFAQRMSGTNLWVLPSGSAFATNQALAGSDGMRARMAELRESFDHVLIDSPALNPSADAMALGRLVDGMLLVLQSNTTRRETARTVIDQIRGANVNLLGAVLNKRTFPIPQNLYARL